MVIISHRAIKEFAALHPQLLMALERWYTITDTADWQGFADIKSNLTQ